MTTRKQKQCEYKDKYNSIPRDYDTRLVWLMDKLKLDNIDRTTITATINTMKEELYYTRFVIVLYEIPEGSPRPRYRVLRTNVSRAALINPKNIIVYSPVGAIDNRYMKRLMTESDFAWMDTFISTPCIVNYKAYLPIPSNFDKIETYLAELGVYPAISKPDWDNIGKKYSDMTNENLWLDDRLVIKGTVEKYYSVLPRIEITIDYLNKCTNRHEAASILKSNKEWKVSYCGDGRPGNNDCGLF